MWQPDEFVQEIYLCTYLQRLFSFLSQNISCTKTFDRIKLWTWDFEITVYKHQNILLLINRISFYRTAVVTFTTKRKRTNWMNIFGLFSPPTHNFSVGFTCEFLYNSRLHKNSIKTFVSIHWCNLRVVTSNSHINVIPVTLVFSSFLLLLLSPFTKYCALLLYPGSSVSFFHQWHEITVFFLSLHIFWHSFLNLFYFSCLFILSSILFLFLFIFVLFFFFFVLLFSSIIK